MNMAIIESEGVIPLIEINPRQAVECAKSTLRQWDQALKSAPGDEFSAPRRARTLMRVALALLSVGRTREALAVSVEAASVFRELLARKPDGMRYQKTALFALAVSGQASAATKRDAEARRAFEEAASIGEQLLAKKQALLSHTIAATYAFDHFGDYWKSRGDAVQARQWFERSRQAWAARTEQTPAVQRRRKRVEERLNGLRL
jgi:hypothetical protein